MQFVRESQIKTANSSAKINKDIRDREVPNAWPPSCLSYFKRLETHQFVMMIF